MRPLSPPSSAIGAHIPASASTSVALAVFHLFSQRPHARAIAQQMTQPLEPDDAAEDGGKDEPQNEFDVTQQGPCPPL